MPPLSAPPSRNSAVTAIAANELLTGLPGASLLRQGLTDVQAGRTTIPACLVHIARTRLCRAGLVPSDAPPAIAEPELQLYRLLRREDGDAYSRYNALLRELVSFESALDQRRPEAPAVSGPRHGPTPVIESPVISDPF